MYRTNEMFVYTLVGDIFCEGIYQYTRAYTVCNEVPMTDSELVAEFKHQAWQKWFMFHGGDKSDLTVIVTTISLLRPVKLEG